MLHVEMGKTTKRKAPQPISLAANSKATKRKKNKKSVVVRTGDEPVARPTLSRLGLARIDWGH